MKCSMMAPRMLGLRCAQSPSDLVTDTKSEPKKTPDTPSIENRAWASAGLAGRLRVADVERACSITVLPGRNFRVAGLGVVSVSMNMEASSRFKAGLR